MDFFTSKTCHSNSNNNFTVDIKIPWVEKYRPKNSEEILLEPFIKQKIEKILETKSIPNMIITGEPGTGKTSTILFLAKQIYGDRYFENVLELNASDDRGLSIINNTIRKTRQKLPYSHNPAGQLPFLTKAIKRLTNTPAHDRIPCE